MGARDYKRGQRKPPLNLSPIMLAVLRYGKLCASRSILKALALRKGSKSKAYWAGHYKAVEACEEELRVINNLLQEQGSKQ